MDSNSVLVVSEGDAASTIPIPHLSALEPAIEASFAVADTPDKKIEMTGPHIGDQPSDSTAPNISLPVPSDPNSRLTNIMTIANEKIFNLRRAREMALDETSDDGIGSDSKRLRLENKSSVLFSVDDDPEEIMAEIEVKDPNWHWPAYDEVFETSGNVRYAKRGKSVKPTTKGSPFQVIYQHARDVVLWPDTVQIKLKSQPLMAILSEYMPDEKDLQHLEKVDVKGRNVYAIVDKLKDHKFSDGDDNSSNNSDGLRSGKGVSHGVGQNVNMDGEIEEFRSMNVTPDLTNPGTGSSVEESRLHLHHLVRFMEEEYKSVALKHKRMKEEKCVSFDMLWAFLLPGTVVVYHCAYTQEQLCAKVSENGYQETQCGKSFIITLSVWDYNGQAYRECTVVRAIGSFSGEKSFDTLAVRPIDMDRTIQASVLEAEFRAKGTKFYQLAVENRNCFMQYTGSMLRIRRDEIVKEKADGRVMIDLKSFAIMNPNFPMRNAQPPVSSTSDGHHQERMLHQMVDFQMRSWPNSARGGRAPREQLARGGSRVVNRAVGPMEGLGLALSERSSISEEKDENLIFAPAVVFGFSFALKQWGAFAVTGFTEIDFDTNAFDALVMESEDKGLLYSLVSQYIATATSSTESESMKELPRVDPIASKGEGCVFLCYGPPGTGKTLTAESLAENLRRPLWALSVAELGTTPTELETTLVRILDIAAMWKAVLLLDEADVYLEKRVAAGDLTRNAMTGVFLRLLEYYRGVLFLTTNRITSFDDAFRSRISLVLCYPKLNKDRRLQIWTKALARIQAGTGEEVKVSPDFLLEMARQKMNGREIRNAIHLAQTLAGSKTENLQEQHLRFVMKVVLKTSNILEANLRDA